MSIAQPAGRMTPQQFIAKWAHASLKERAAAQQHFIDLCLLLGQPTPAQADAQGAWYTFEKGVTKAGGGDGWADVWMRGHFAWEYKSPGEDLAAAYKQLVLYAADLENPPLLVVCDIARYEIHTNFTGTKKQVYRFTNADLADPEVLGILRKVFTDPEALRPEITTESVTQEAAAKFASLAGSLTARGFAPERVARFLTRLLFCLFAEDIGLLPKGLFTRLLDVTRQRPDTFARQILILFETMRDGGIFGVEEIARFNGDLFADPDAIELTREELGLLAEAARLDWGSIEPAIFGTLFERGLDPAKRAQLGAHYTSRDDILRVVEPVVMEPLRREWAAVRARADVLAEAFWAAKGPSQRERRRKELASVLLAFQERLASVTILDPACGSGNFLYVALEQLKNLEKEVISYAAHRGLSMLLPQVTPRQLHGIETNAYAHELAQIVVWIGYIQWMTMNGFQVNRDPVLEPMDTVLLMDAILDRSDPAQPREPAWPDAEFIIGNPPFLGGKRLRTELGDEYVDAMFAVYNGRVPREADLCCYWFEKARAMIAAGRVKRAGLLATNSIRGGANRRVLERIKESGDIFMAWDDEPWVLDGAAVRISMVGFDDGTEKTRTLDGVPVAAINPDLTGALDLTTARPLAENLNIAFMGDTKGGPFDIPGDLARQMLAAPLNPNGRPNSDVIVPWVNGLDITRRPRDMWIIDFGPDMPLEQAALYEQPFEYVKKHVYPVRQKSRSTRNEWWLHERPRVDMRDALRGLSRFIGTPTVAKHRLFVWLSAPTLPDHQLIVFARDDDYFFGVLHSRAHELWSLRMGTSLEDRPRYTPTTCFETFPFPRPTEEQREAIAAAARALHEHRERWLNPEGASEAELKQRTLTNLYNARPTWLDNLHRELDRAVFAAYGWPDDLSDDEILARLLALNLERAGA
ncbi:class I SAM-dependent DNA methyltransferase [Sphaerobacter thermophilus]|nr:DNA methyltransferase [Sphaerobacter thermophilus]